MVVEYPLYGQSCTLAVTLYSRGSSDFTLFVGDADDEGIAFTDRNGKVKDGESTYYVRMPICPDVAYIELGSSNESIDIVDIEILDLPTDFSNPLFKREDVMSFIDFAEEFSYNASHLETDAEYKSDDNMFTISYLPKIINSEGNVEETPARISQQNGLIEVSKADFLRYTIPMRLAILLHEFSHYYLNVNMEDEVEADKNSLILYMGLGYPRIDAYNVYLDVFESTPTELNKERYSALQKLFKQKYLS